MLSKLRSRLTYGNVVATLALFVALGGTAAASVIVTSNSQVAQNTISGHKPPSGDHANVVSGSINGQDLATGAATTPKLGNAAVTNSKLGSNAVTGAKVLDNSLTGNDINESALNGSQITGVNASQLGGADAGSYTRQSSSGVLALDGTNSGQTVQLFGGPVPNIGTFTLHCQTGNQSSLHVVANSGQQDASFLQEQRNGAPPVVGYQTVNDSSGQSVQLPDSGATSITWQFEDVDINTLVATKVVTLVLNFELGSIAPNQCGYAAQLLTGQATSP